MEEDVRYCRCGNVKIIQSAANKIILVRLGSENRELTCIQRFPSLVEIRQSTGFVHITTIEKEARRLLHCNSCDLDIVSVEGVSTSQDLGNATNVTLLNTIDEVLLL